jgi:hypothetical protein
MAKRVVKWTLDGMILKLSKALEDPKSEVVIEAEFDLAKLFPSFIEYSEVQKQLVVYGTKQKLMDSGASDIGDGMTKIQSAKAKWAELLEGKWSGDRVNATGAAENKRIVSEVKEATKVVSLQGLMLKKLVYPATFTEEDEAKLQEFLAEVAKTGKRK